MTHDPTSSAPTGEPAAGATFHVFFVHRDNDRSDGQFFLGMVFARTDGEARKLARQRWPHWSGEMVLQRERTKFYGRSQVESVKA